MATQGGRSLKLSFILLFYTAYIHDTADGIRVEGTLSTKEDWEFIARFCFLSEKGSLNFEFEYPQKYEVQNVLLYFDEPGQWAAVYKSEKTCYQKEAALRPENNQVINLTTRYTWSGCKAIKKSDEDYLVCSGGRTFRSARERWWFIALSNCATTKGLQVKYKLHMTNSDDMDWQKEFSADEFYILDTDIGVFLISLLQLMLACTFAHILESDIGFLFLTFFTLALSVYVAGMLRMRQLFHTTYKMFMVAIVSEALYLLIKVIAYAIQKDTGYRYEELIVFARVFHGINVIVFLLMLILMGKGYTITRGRLSHSGSVKITVFTCFYSIAYIVVFINELVIRDEGQQLYLYENPGGYVLIALRLLGWLWFCYAIFFTLKNYPEKNKFYYPFFIIYTCWFWVGPIMIFIAMRGIPLWMREKVVNGVEHLIELIGHGIFLMLTRPSAANSNFPYHVRTSQIGVLNTTQSIPNGASTECESFGAHPYAPSGPPDYDDVVSETKFDDMFCTDRNKSSRNGRSSNNNHVNIDRFPRDTMATMASGAPPVPVPVRNGRSANGRAKYSDGR